MIVGPARLLAAISALLLGGCDTSTVAPVQDVADQFNVGVGTYVRSLAVDGRTGSLWVGTSAGVMEIDLASNDLVNTFTRKDPLANEYVFAIGVDSQGYKWFGTNAGGASRYKDGTWKVFFPMHGLADYWVYAFAEQAGGQYWIGTWAGANKVDLETLTFTTFRKELINEWVYAIAVDTRDRVWFGTEGGVSMLDGDRWTHWTHEDGLGAPNARGLPISRNTGLGTRTRHDLSIIVGGDESYNPNYVFSILVDARDAIWAGTWGGGVAKYENGQWTNFTEADGLAGNIVYAMTQDVDGVYWFGTNAGLSRFDGRAWRNYGIAEGLPGKDVYAVVAAPGGDVWAGTLNGVVRLARPAVQSGR